MSTDPDANGGPDADWFRSELTACREEISRLHQENAELRERLSSAKGAIEMMKEMVDAGVKVRLT